MKHTLLLIVMLCVTMLEAISAEEFLIGTYTQYDLYKTASNTGDRLSALGQKLYAGGFNSANISIGTSDINLLSTAISSLSNNDIKTILTDKAWDFSSGKTGLYAMGKGNYWLKFK